MKFIFTQEEFDQVFSDVTDRNQFGEVKARIQEKIQSYFQNQNFSPEELNDLRDRLYKMIDYAIRRYDDYSTQRHRYLTLGIGLIGSSVALLGIFATNYSKLAYWAIFFGSISLAILFLSGVIVLVLYNISMTPDYPHREIMDIRSWYFKYKLKGSLLPGLSKDTTKAVSQVKEVAENYLDGIEDWITKSKMKNYFIKEDLEQVAILHLLQKYGRDSLEKMKIVMNAGIVLFAIFFVLALVLQGIFSGK